MKNRKVVQMFAQVLTTPWTTPTVITFALCDDGTLWQFYDSVWKQYPNIPEQVQQDYEDVGS